MEEIAVDGKTCAAAQDPGELRECARLVEPVECGSDGGQAGGCIAQRDLLGCCHEVAGAWLRPCGPQHRG